MNKAVVAAGLGFTLSAVVGCGSSGGLLSSAQATRLRTQLDQASAALNAGECGSAAGYISNFQDDVDALGSVNSTLISNLEAGAAKIETLARKDCPTTTTPTPTHTTPPRPHTTPAKTTPTVPQTVPTTSSTSSTDTNTNPDTTTTGTGTSSTSSTSSTSATTPPGTGLTGPATSSTPTSSAPVTNPTTPTTPAPPPSGGAGLNGGTPENGQRRSFAGSALPRGWQRREGAPGGWHGNGAGYRGYDDGDDGGQGQGGGS